MEHWDYIGRHFDISLPNTQNVLQKLHFKAEGRCERIGISLYLMGGIAIY